MDTAPRNGGLQGRMGRAGILQEWRPICVCYATSVVVEGETTPEMASRTEHGSLESATGNQQIGCTGSLH